MECVDKPIPSLSKLKITGDKRPRTECTVVRVTENYNGTLAHGVSVRDYSDINDDTLADFLVDTFDQKPNRYFDCPREGVYIAYEQSLKEVNADVEDVRREIAIRERSIEFIERSIKAGDEADDDDKDFIEQMTKEQYALQEQLVSMQEGTYKPTTPPKYKIVTRRFWVTLEDAKRIVAAAKEKGADICVEYANKNQFHILKEAMTPLSNLLKLLSSP